MLHLVAETNCSKTTHTCTPPHLGAPREDARVHAQLHAGHVVGLLALLNQRVAVHQDVAVYKLTRLKKQSFATGFSRWVKGHAQGLEPGGFKLWVNWIRCGSTGFKLFRPPCR
jgi:hypothetical protein